MEKPIIIGAGIIESTMIAHAMAKLANIEVVVIDKMERGVSIPSPFQTELPYLIKPLIEFDPQKIYILTTDDKKQHLHKKFHDTAKATNGIRCQGTKNKNSTRNPVFHARKLPRPKK